MKKITIVVLVVASSFAFAPVVVDAQDFWQQTNGLYGGIVRSLAISPSGHVFAGTDSGFFRSTDNGDSWTTVYTGLTRPYVSAIAINTSGHIFAGTGDGIFHSTDNGDGWTAVYTPSAYTYFNFLAINASGHVFAATTRDGIFRSTDNGDSWTAVNTGLTNLFVSSLAINASGHIFAATGDGIFRSIDNGDSWTAIITGLTNLYVLSLAIDPSGYVFAGTDGSGVFRSRESTTAVRENSGEMPTSVLLEQNYPNPFNPSTTIEFALPKSSFVTLKIYNTLGAEIATLVSEKLPAGRHQRVWEASGLASGVYLYRIAAGDPSTRSGQGFVQTKKLILLR